MPEQCCAKSLLQEQRVLKDWEREQSRQEVAVEAVQKSH